MLPSRLVKDSNRTYPFDSELWIEGSAWYKVRGLRIVEKDEAPLFIGRRPSRESGSIRFSETSFIMAVGFPAFRELRIGWRQYKPTRFFEHLIRKTFGWLFFYLIGFMELRSSACGLRIAQDEVFFSETVYR